MPFALRAFLCRLSAALFFRRRNANTSTFVDRRRKFNRTRPCSFAGCNGTMYIRDALETAPAPHTLEWPWRPTWVCAQDSAHSEVASAAEYFEGLRVLRRKPENRTHVNGSTSEKPPR